jgi:hypothetical protein
MFGIPLLDSVPVNTFRTETAMVDLGWRVFGLKGLGRGMHYALSKQWETIQHFPESRGEIPVVAFCEPGQKR